MKNEVMNAVKLTSNALDSIAARLQNLTAANENVSKLAYEGAKADAALSCSCKGCEGCTSW